jgi:hypothetical protein
MHQSDPGVGFGCRPNQEAFGGAATRQPVADQARRKDARVVDHEQIAVAKQ